MAALAAVFGLCVNAQTWTASEVGEGTFYLYNVGAQGYLVGANSWGTQASIAKTGGISVTLAGLDGGNYSVSCAPTYQNMYLGANGYIDRPVGESSWQFVPVEGQTNVYRMTCSDGMFFANAGATSTGVGGDPGWKELITNGDVEGEDGTCLITQDGEGQNQGAHKFNPVEGAGIDGSKAAVVHIAAGSKYDWTGQFFIYAPDHVFAEGEKFKVSFWVKADKAADVDIQSHTTAGNYIGWYVDGFSGPLKVTTEWQQVTIEGTIKDFNAETKMVGMQTLAFNLSKDKENENNFYFDNISWKVYDESATQYSYWKLVSQENRIADLASATADNPKDATFLILNPNFSRNATNSAWTMQAGNQNLQGGTNENKCAESYHSEFNLSQVVSGAPAGNYGLTAQGFYRQDGEDTEHLPVIFVNEGTSTFGPLTGSENSMDQASTSFLAGEYAIAEAQGVSTGELTVGAKLEGNTTLWCIWDNFQLKYYGPISDLGPFIEAYEKALAEAQALLNTEETCSKNSLASLRAATILNGEARVDKNSQESLEKATAALNEAINAVKKSIDSYKIIAAGEVPSNNIAGWTCTNEQAFHVNTWSTEADNTGMVTPFIENWIHSSEGTLGDGMIYYTLEGLNPGEVYYAQALVRAFSEAGNEIGGVSFFVNDDETDIPTTGNAYTYNGKPGVYGTFGNIATVGTDGKLTIGVKLNGATFNWVAIKNVTIQSLDAALQASVDKVEAYYGQIPTAVETPTKEFVETTKASVTDNASFQEAVKALNAKADELAPIAKAFAEAKALSNYKSKYYDAVKAMADVTSYKEFAEGAHDKLNAALNAFALPAVDMETLNAMTTAEAINEYAAGLKAQAAEADEALRAAGIEYNNNAAPVGDAKFNISFVLVNANLEGLPTWAKCDGWYSDRTTGNSQVMQNNDATSEDGTKTAFYEYWSEAAADDGSFTLYQKVELPAGKYDVSCYAFAQQNASGNEDNCNVKFYANDFEGPVIASTRLAPASFEFETAEAGEVKIGLKALEGNNFRWMGIGYMELYRNGIAEEPKPVFALSFNPASGTEVAVDDEITMTFDDANFNLHYTTDGSDPKTSMTMMTAMPNETVTVKGEGALVIKAYLVYNKTDEESDIFTALYPIKEVEEENWESLVINGNVEGTDGTSLVTQDGEGENQGAHKFNPVEGAGVGGSTGAVVHVAAGSKYDYTGQFFIYEPSHEFKEGEKYKVSFWVKADKDAEVDIQAHTTPGNYIGWYIDGFSGPLKVSTEWQKVTIEGTISEAMAQYGAHMVGMQTLAFNLSKNKEVENNFYFDNIVWKVYVEPAKDLELTDDDTEAPAAGEYANVTYNRMFLKGYNTIVLPFEYTIAELGADIVMKYVGTQDNHVQFQRLPEETVLQANTPYVVFVAADKQLKGFENKTVVEPTDLTVAGGEFDFVGSYKAYAKGESPVVKGDYILREVGLQKAAGGNEHKAYRGYLKNNTGMDVNLYLMIDGEIVDGINTIENAQNADGSIYNLNGQKVKRTQKGVYIINGKKVVRK